MTEYDEEHVANHEARHASAALILGLPVHTAAAFPKAPVQVGPNRLVYGQVNYRWDVTDLAELTDEEARAAAITAMVGFLDGDPDRYWPPAWPSKKGETGDEQQIAAYINRLGLDFDGWKRLCSEARELCASRDFIVLKDAITHLLLRDGFLTADTLKQAHHIVTTGKRAMPTFQVEASSTALPSRGAFAAIFDVTTPTRSKPRVKFGALAPAIATRQAAGQPIPILGIAGNLLGHADPSTLEETCGGVFFKGRLNLESAEAIDMLRSVKANSVQVEYSEDLRELTLHRAFKTEPKKRPAWSGDATRAAMELEAVLLPKPDGTVTHREQLQVEVDAGLQDADELKRYDEIAQQTRDQMHRIMATPLADAYIERERTRQAA